MANPRGLRGQLLPSSLTLSVLLLLILTTTRPRAAEGFNPAGTKAVGVPPLHHPDPSAFLSTTSKNGVREGEASHSPLFAVRTRENDVGGDSADGDGAEEEEEGSTSETIEPPRGSRRGAKLRGVLNEVASRVGDGIRRRGRAILAISALLTIIVPVGAPPAITSASASASARTDGAERAKLYSQRDSSSSSAQDATWRTVSAFTRSSSSSATSGALSSSRAVARSGGAGTLPREEEARSIARAALGSTVFFAGALAGGTLMGRSLLSVLDEDDELLSEVRRRRRRDEYLEITTGGGPESSGRRPAVEGTLDDETVEAASEGKDVQASTTEDEERARQQTVNSIFSNAQSVVEAKVEEAAAEVDRVAKTLTKAREEEVTMGKIDAVLESAKEIKEKKERKKADTLQKENEVLKSRNEAMQRTAVDLEARARLEEIALSAAEAEIAYERTAHVRAKDAARDAVDKLAAAEDDLRRVSEEKAGLEALEKIEAAELQVAEDKLYFAEEVARKAGERARLLEEEVAKAAEKAKEESTKARETAAATAPAETKDGGSIFFDEPEETVVTPPKKEVQKAKDEVIKKAGKKAEKKSAPVAAEKDVEAVSADPKEEKKPTPAAVKKVVTAMSATPKEAKKPTPTAAKSEEVVRTKSTQDASTLPSPNADRLRETRIANLHRRALRRKGERARDVEIALRQPKSKRAEKRLAAKYGALDSLEDRAFAVLLDLGMVEITPDPESPEYDPTDDHEIAPENVFP